MDKIQPKVVFELHDIIHYTYFTTNGLLRYCHKVPIIGKNISMTTFNEAPSMCLFFLATCVCDKYFAENCLLAIKP